MPRAYVVLKPTHNDTPQLRKDIQDYLDARVAPHKVWKCTRGRMVQTPRIADNGRPCHCPWLASHQKLRGGLDVIKEIPKSASGKILRRLLKPQVSAAKL